MRRRTLGLLVALATAALPALVQISTASAFNADTLVSVGSPTTPFSQNKQNEPAVAIDANHPNVVVAGANDNIDMEACNAGDDTTCPFTPGVGGSGVYFSFDSGTTWTQPTYTGLTARGCLGAVGDSDPGCTPQMGPIGTLPWYSEEGLVSDGDPAVAFGPTPDAQGNFSWSNGSRLYYANLTSNLGAQRSEFSFKGVEAIGVSRTDDAATAAAGGAAGMAAWKRPVTITGSNSAAGFADKEQIWADNAETSDFFGNVYVCFARYVGGPSVGSAAHALDVATSLDGGDTWTTQTVQNIPGSSSGQPFFLSSGASGCTVRTDSGGTVYVFWLGFDKQSKTQGIYLTRSFDGGSTFEQAHRLFPVVAPGVLDPVLGRTTMDGIAGARNDLSPAPSVDIANGAPTGSDATDQIVLTWVDGLDGLNNEHVIFTTSTDGAETWSDPLRHVEEEIGHPSDRGYYSAPAISPDGTDVYLVYNVFLEPYKESTIGAANDRPLGGVVVHADVALDGTVGTFSEIHRSAPGDARGTSQNNPPIAEFLGDYVYAAATRTYGAAVWNDARNAADCPAIDSWRMSQRTGDSVPRPAPQQDCPATFGNSDIFGGSYQDPTP
jgi:hypothetical protein